jgi:hypothetical protein
MRQRFRFISTLKLNNLIMFRNLYSNFKLGSKTKRFDDENLVLACLYFV